MDGQPAERQLAARRLGKGLRSDTERWRRVWEFSLLILVSTTFFYAHNYYLALLILPMNSVLSRLTGAPFRLSAPLILAPLAYLLLTSFLVPPTYLSRALGFDVWELYFASLAYFSGTMVLLGLVLHQYVTLPVGPPADILSL